MDYIMSEMKARQRKEQLYYYRRKINYALVEDWVIEISHAAAHSLKYQLCMTTLNYHTTIFRATSAMADGVQIYYSLSSRSTDCM